MCRWCGLWIKDADGNVLSEQKFCGAPCKTHYQLRADPQKMRQHVFFRDGGKCARCGYVHPYLDGDWEADHVIPLMIGLSDPALFEPDNVVVMCTAPNRCHYDKSAEDRRTYRKKFRRTMRDIYAEIAKEIS